MCGIIGFLGNTNCIEYIISGLKLLQNRGYDSAGISYINNNMLDTIKYASTNISNSIELLETNINKEIKSNLCIGHTRWATHGPKTDINAHPHNDSTNTISLVHNGIIENYITLKNELIQEGYFFASETDTEVIVQLIHKYLKLNFNINEAIKNTVSRLEGTWALTIIHKDYPNKMWITKNGSPLLLGIENNYILVASEVIAFNNYITKYIVLNNNDLIEIEMTDDNIKFDRDIANYALKQNNNNCIDTIPNDYAHWMLKEIMEQNSSVNRAINNGGRLDGNTKVKLGGLDDNKELLLSCNHLILLGCGTSYHAGLWSLNLFKSLDIFETVTIYNGADFNIYDIPKKGKSSVILLSQSGETKDLHRCLDIAKDYDLITIGVVNVIDSTIARETNCGVYLNAGREVAVASTKSFTNQCVILSLISIWFSQNKGTSITKRKQIINDLRNFPYQVNKLFDNLDILDSIVDNFTNCNSCFILGKDMDQAIALESSLKLKEISYIHAEGFSSSALKHGPFALITEENPIIIIDTCSQYKEKNQNAYEEIKSRNGNIISFTSNHLNFIDRENIIHVENNNTYSSLLVNIYLQLLTYKIAIRKNINPDFPRNLAKVVTVE
jgi:glucosamine--fructose-6-phosphate aminotransferase (isomerizing)